MTNSFAELELLNSILKYINIYHRYLYMLSRSRVKKQMFRNKISILIIDARSITFT